MTAHDWKFRSIVRKKLDEACESERLKRDRDFFRRLEQRHEELAAGFDSRHEHEEEERDEARNRTPNPRV